MNIVVPSQPEDPRDKLSDNEVLLRWQASQAALAQAKTDEMEWRKYAVKRSFPEAHEGTNTKELGGGYTLKAAVKYNYKLDPDVNKVWSMLQELKTIGNDGAHIADNLVRWEANFLLTEYRKIQDGVEKESTIAKQQMLCISKALTISEAAPTLDIKEPKRKS